MSYNLFMKILIVEDDTSISSFIARGLKESGFSTDEIHDGNEALNLIRSNPSYGLIVLDLMLPGCDGLNILAEMRNAGIKTPVIILSAKRTLDDRVKGIQVGGDDYLTKPFSFSELLVRIQALLRRSNPIETHSAVLKNFGIEMDMIKREVTRESKKIELQTKEFNLLEVLMRNPERILSKTVLLEHVYSYQFDPQTNVVDVLVCRLRNKIDKNFKKKLIHTIRGSGYVLKAE